MIRINLWISIVASFFILSQIDTKNIGVEENVSDLIDSRDDFCGYYAKDKPIVYNKDNLHQYIDGGALIYIKNGFNKLITHELIKSGDTLSSITIEIYCFDSLKDAKDIFLYESGKENFKLPGGAFCRKSGGLLQFHKGKYFVKIMSFGEEKHLQNILVEIAGTIEARIE
ncbi:MAG: DUF6599 family protein [Thermodesulfobacteriota bacterium]|nr:DUF6599 family protein [Thermodesulfobacteriota bacterium]